ncbi:hypothetical protein HPB50_028022 [Hyalomma asiaticum]|nr:hypothetical protein HPB50_028022 [Hyalomma asiaticum]
MHVATGSHANVSEKPEKVSSMLRTVKHFDYLVIGGGSGSIASARRAAEYGAKVAVIEDGPLGGTCVNAGCVPEKLCYYCASMAEMMKDLKDYGFDTAGPAPSRQLGRFQSQARRLHRTPERHLRSEPQQEPGLVGQRSHQVRLPEDGARSEYGTTSDGSFKLEKVPRKRDPVTLLTCTDHILRVFEPLCWPRRSWSTWPSKGVLFEKNCTVASITKVAHWYKVVTTTNEKIHEVDSVLWAVGRKPRVDLDLTGDELDKTGHIKVDEYENTPSVYALGDVCDKWLLTPVVIAAGHCLSERLFNNKPNSKLVYENIPTVIFSHPPIGTIGMTLAQAETKYRVQIKANVQNNIYAHVYYSMIERKSKCIMMLVCAGPEQKAVTLHMISDSADEILQGFGVAVKMGATKAQFDSCVDIHPTSAKELVTMR